MPRRTLYCIRSLTRLTVTTVAIVASVGCNQSASTDLDLPGAGPADAFWSVTLRDHAINLTDDTLDQSTSRVRLEATPRNVRGVPLEGVTTSPTFEVLNPLSLSVDSAGWLTGRRPGEALRVRVVWQIEGVTHADTAYVNVTDTAPTTPLDVFTYQPAPGDSAKWSFTILDLINGPKLVTPRAFATTGEPIPVESVVNFIPVSGIRVEYESRNPDVLSIDRLTGAIGVSIQRADTATLLARTYAYGVRRQDSVRYQVGLPTYVTIQLKLGKTRFTPDTVVIGVGGIVSFINSTTQAIAVQFDRPEFATTPFYLPDGESGNISVLDTDVNGGFGVRQFFTAGTYIYRDTQGREYGVIQVRAD